jgi:hypothetical protein
MKQQRVLIHVVEILIWKQKNIFPSKVENGCTLSLLQKKSDEKGMRWVIAFAHL